MPQKKQICLVTGANSGIGKAITMGLAQSGAQVVMICRNQSKAEKVIAEIKSTFPTATIDLLIADLSSQQDIQRLVGVIKQTYDQVNVLVNNAGVFKLKREESADGLEMTLATNVVSPYLLTMGLADLLKQGAPARVINISSAAHKWAALDMDDMNFSQRKYSSIKAYTSSKLLMNLETFALADYFAQWGVTVNCVHPGAVKTHLGTEDNYPFYYRIIDKLVKLFFISPKKSAKPIIDMALSPQWLHVTGKYVVHGKVHQASAQSYRADLRTKLMAYLSTMSVDLK